MIRKTSALLALFALLGAVGCVHAARVSGGAGSGVSINGTCPSGYIYSSDGAGNVNCLPPFTSYYADVPLIYPQRVQNTNTTFYTTSPADDQYGMAVFSHSVSSETNWVEYKTVVPVDIDTTTDLGAFLKIRLNGADTGTHRYVLDMAVVSDSANSPSTFSNGINLDMAGDASGASGDWESVTLTTLTGWKAALATAAGKLWIIRLMRDGDAAQDTSTTGSTAFPIIRYYRQRPD